MHEYIIKIFCSLYIIFWVDLQSASHNKACSSDPDDFGSWEN